METEPAGIDGGQVSVVVGGIDARQDFAHFFLAEDCGKAMFRLGAKDIEDMPVVLQDVSEEEPDTAVTDAHGFWRPVIEIFW